MDCRDVEQRMDRYLDRDLAAEDARELESHLAQCPRCRAEWNPLVQFLTKPQPVEVPAGLRDRIVEAVERAQTSVAVSPAARSTERPPAWWMRRSGWAAAACVAFFMMGWLASRLSSPLKPVQHVEETVVSPDAPQVVLSPWLVSSIAQARLMPVPVSPAVVLASGLAAEVIAELSIEDEPPVRVYQPPRSGAASQPADVLPSQEIPFIPWVPRYPGA